MEYIVKCPQCDKNYETQDCVKQETTHIKCGKVVHTAYFCICSNCSCQYAWGQEQHTIGRFRFGWKNAEEFLKRF